MVRFRPVAAGTLQSILCPRRWSSTCALKSAAGARGGYYVENFFAVIGITAHLTFFEKIVVNFITITYRDDVLEGWNIADNKYRRTICVPRRAVT